MNNTVVWSQYLEKFDEIITASTPAPPYDNPLYFDYLKLNQKRQNRWLKLGVIRNELIDLVQHIYYKQTWLLITEPWCGDAAHSVPFIYKLAKNNPLISLRIVWRDSTPFLIDDYLTNGGKAVPKLIIRNEAEEDLAVWGPRPKPCQNIFLALKEKGADFEEQKITLQNWYNADKGQTLQDEFIPILRGLI